MAEGDTSLRRVIKDVAVYSVGDLLLRASAFVTLPIYTRILTPTDYGIWAYVTSGVTLISAMLALGGDQTYSRFYFEARTLEARQKLTSTWVTFLLAWSTAVVVLLLPASGAASQAAFGTQKWSLLIVLILLTGPVTLLNILLGLVVRNEFRPKLYMTLNIVLTVLTVGLSLLFAVGFDWGITGLAAGQLVAMCLLVPARVWYARHLLRPQFDGRLLRTLLRFALPLVPGTVAWWIFGFSDRIVLAHYSTLHEVGLYSVANSATTVLALLVSAVALGWAPHALRLYEERPEEARILYGRMLTVLIVTFGTLAVVVTTFAHELLTVFVGREFLGAERAVGPLALGFVAFATTQVTSLGMTVRKRTTYLALVAWAAAIVNIVLNLIFVPPYGMVASAWATTASFAFITVGYFVIGQRLWPFVVEHRRVLIASTLAFAFTVLAPALPDFGVAAAVAVKLVYVGAFAALLLVTRTVDRRELAVAVDAFRRFDPRALRRAAA
ncbi:MAG TPA: flippase [Gaiellaceae bacterium]|jgi:O-antigen/teichoic acid export membrane protein|nr:flippase [Gaiellaceae bacterium]